MLNSGNTGSYMSGEGDGLVYNIPFWVLHSLLHLSALTIQDGYAW